MKALIVVDLQNDFMPGGALAVKDGFDVIAIANKLMPRFDVVVATQDYHPSDHGSFYTNHPHKKPYEHVYLSGVLQILWPPHCVQNTVGADFVAGLNREEFDHVVQKGTDKMIDSYSAFFDNAHKRATGLHTILTEAGVRDVYFVGVATDYCVKYSVLDALALGYHAYVFTDGCRGVNLMPGDSERAFDEMKAHSATLLTSADW